MKPLFILVIVMTSFSRLVNAQAALTTTSPSAINSFQKTFKEAKNVEWELTADLFKAKFIYNGQLTYAFFNEQGDLICIGRSTGMQQIPTMLQLSFQNRFSDYSIRETFEISTHGGTSYYVTITKNGKKIILKSSGMDNWSVLIKEKETAKVNQ